MLVRRIRPSTFNPPLAVIAASLDTRHICGPGTGFNDRGDSVGNEDVLMAEQSEC